MHSKKVSNPKWNSLIIIIAIIVALIVFGYFKKAVNEKTSVQKAVKLSQNLVGKSFKQVLKDKGLIIDSNFSNSYETLKTGNLYGNSYYKLEADLPDGWSTDRGIAEYTLIRASKVDSQKVISINVVSNKNNSDNEEQTNRYQESPIDEVYNSIGDGTNIKTFLIKNLENHTSIKISDMEVNSEIIGSTNYLVFMYWYSTSLNNKVIEMASYNFQTLLNGNTYTITYVCPKEYKDYKTIESVMRHINFSHK